MKPNEAKKGKKMSKCKKEIKHCEKCNKPFSVYQNSTETLCAKCKEAVLEDTLRKNGYSAKHRMVRNIFDAVEESLSVTEAASKAARDSIMSIQKTCRDCGKSFEITRAERIFFESRGLALPKRCPACRKARKEARKENN